MSQMQLAEIALVKQRRVSAIENGKQNITVRTMNALAKAVGTDVQRLLDNPEEK